MKAMLLAAGRGTRMRELTANTAKPLLKVDGTRLIEYHLNKLQNSGITDVVINTYWHAQQVQEIIGDGSRYQVRIQYSNEQQALEVAGGVANALPLLGAEPFLLISTDIWIDIDFRHINPLTKDKLAHLILVDNPPHHSNGDFTLQGHQVIRNACYNTHTYSGIGIFSPQLFKGAEGKVMPLRSVLYPAIKQQLITGAHHTGEWMDIGTPERLRSLNIKLSDGNQADRDTNTSS